MTHSGGDGVDPTASARLAGMLQRLQAVRQSAPPTAAPAANRPVPPPGAPIPLAIAAARKAGGLFYDKGAATADSFRPWYWSYERQAEAQSPVETETAPAAAAIEAAPVKR